MATLEKIRNKSVILFVIIIVALLAFILGDFLTSSRSLFGPGTTAAKVDGKKIDIQDFQREVEKQRELAQSQGYDYDIALIQEGVMQEMIRDVLLNEAYDDLGIVVTDEELSKAILGEKPLPLVINYLVYSPVGQQYGIQSPTQLYDLANNPSKYNLQPEQAEIFKNAYTDLENQTSDQLKLMKYMQLLGGALATNNIDAKSYYDDNFTTAKISFVRKDLSEVPNDAVSVSQDEIKNLYEERKNRYAIKEETRPVDYIRVAIEPSAEDQTAASNTVENALMALNEEDGLDAVNKDYNFDVQRVSQPDYAWPVDITNQLDSFPVGSARILPTMAINNYTIAKLMDTYTDIDSVWYDVIVIPGDSTTRKNVLAQISEGVSIDTLLANGSVSNALMDQILSLADPRIDPSYAKQFKEQEFGEFIIPDFAVGNDGTQELGQAIRVNARKEAPYYDIAIINYAVKPSQATLATLKQKLAEYAKANNTPETFAKNAAAAGYLVSQANVTPSSLRVADVKDSRGAAKWAMNAKKGQVSEVYGNEQSGSYLVVAVKDIYKGDFKPVTDAAVNRELSTILTNKKKGEKLVSDYKGKASNLQGYADLMGTTVEKTDVAFGRNTVDKIPGVNNHQLMAKVATMQPGTVSEPFYTDNGVFVVELEEVQLPVREFNFDTDAATFNRQMGSERLSQSMDNILLGNKKVKNNLQEFYNE